MKRTGDYLNNNNDINKKARFSQAATFGDIYSQYAGLNAALMMNAGGNGAMYGTMADYNGAQGNMMANSQFGGNFAPGFMAVGLNQGSGTQGDFNRTIYLGNVGSEVTATDILNHVKTGAIESCRMLPEKGCAFLCFADTMGAQGFFQEYNTKSFTVQGHDIKVGWGKPSVSQFQVQQAIQAGATRNVYIGKLDDNMDEDEIKSDLARFGDIEQVKIIPDKKIAFVHFLTVTSAMKCVSTLPTEPNWSNRRINYGKDRCAPNVRPGQMGPMGGMAGAGGAGAGGPFMFGDGEGHFQFGFNPYGAGAAGADGSGGAAGGGGGNAAAMMSGFGMPNNVAFAAGPLQRTLYLGNIAPETTCEEICNSIRGGMLYQIRFMEDKHMAFVTFVDPNAAINVFNTGQNTGIAVKGRRLRVGWGKPTAIPTPTLIAIQQGASRNIYLGGTENKFTVDQLRQDFAEFGDMELISILPEKNCAFVNFTNINSAMKAVKGIKSKPDYASLKVNYGKDRCDGPPRRRNPNQQQNQQNQNQNQQNQQRSSVSPLQSPTLSQTKAEDDLSPHKIEDNLSE
ncbi:unnamed protein product [Cunninghamella echinulata]